ncbi:MAG: ribonuclease III [Dehalococcoidia bacterium]|nr:ribonuclease III [Dehalococcoidia bacterium]
MLSDQSKSKWCLRSFNYGFRDISLLQVSLTHRSYSAENNERLEFLGDAVLDLVLSDLLFQSYPLVDEGNLSRLRASIVNEKSLSSIARQLNINEQIILGEGENLSGGQQRDSILANTLEAIVGAIYIDSDFETVAAVIRAIFKDSIDSIDPSLSYKDDKSALQELLQQQQKNLPEYRLIKTTGEKHDQNFLINCLIKD